MVGWVKELHFAFVTDNKFAFQFHSYFSFQWIRKFPSWDKTAPDLPHKIDREHIWNGYILTPRVRLKISNTDDMFFELRKY